MKVLLFLELSILRSYVSDESLKILILVVDFYCQLTARYCCWSFSLCMSQWQPFPLFIVLINQFLYIC